MCSRSQAQFPPLFTITENGAHSNGSSCVGGQTACTRSPVYLPPSQNCVRAICRIVGYCFPAAGAGDAHAAEAESGGRKTFCRTYRTAIATSTVHDRGGQARFEPVSDQVEVVRDIFTRVGQERCSLGEVCRLPGADRLTATGKHIWSRQAVWDILQNSVYQGAAADGKTCMMPRTRESRPRLYSALRSDQRISSLSSAYQTEASARASDPITVTLSRV
ncbi:MAG: recombinase family protein [Bryobacteraceae bacterium]